MWVFFFYGLFFTGLAALAHTYLIYPLLLRFWSKGQQLAAPVLPLNKSNWPRVSIIMAAYNEEKVIQEKLESLVQLNYPKDRLHFFLGSDASSDQTEELSSPFEKNNPWMEVFAFKQRRGKPGVINDLTKRALDSYGASDQHILLYTDASVMLEKETLARLVRHFQRPGIGLVDAHLVHTGMQEAGISQAENQYITAEVLLKHREGQLWGCMMGPFGGCFALRSDFFEPIPGNFLVDDFFLALTTLKRGGKAISDLEARCREAIGQELKQEYRRKKRISSGNFQNMRHFNQLWWPPVFPLGWSFFSHKILRWLGPIWLIAMLAGAGGLTLTGNLFFQLLFLLMTAGVALAFLADYLLRLAGLHFLPLRGLTYFFLMNLALIEGFVEFAKGIRTNVWEPTQRN